MDQDDDDFYGNGASAEQEAELTLRTDGNGAKTEDGVKQESEEEGEEDSDDDIQFTLEKPENTSSEPPSKVARTQAPPANRTASPHSRQRKASTPLPGSQQPARASSTQPPKVPTVSGKEGKDYPIPPSKSTIDPNPSVAPTWPSSNKPITTLDIDADLATHSKPWRLPGTDQTDFFNYGFDEYTWTQYCLKVGRIGKEIEEGRESDRQMKAWFDMMGGPPGGGGGPGGMPPGMAEMMMGGGGGMPPPEMMQMMGMGGPPQGPGGQGGGGGGPPHNAPQGPQGQSPHPQGQGGFHPPQGPAAQHGGQGQSGGDFGGMEGYSAQQMAMMGQGGPGFMGGGRGRGGRRGGRFH